MKRWVVTTGAMVMALGLARPAGAAVNVSLTLSPTGITFPDADPDLVPSIPAAQSVGVSVRATGGITAWNLSVQAFGDLVSQASSIPINQIRWTATGRGFIPGQMSKTAAQPVASGFNNSGPPQDGTLSFFLINSWQYAPGNYSQTLLFTLVAQ